MNEGAGELRVSKTLFYNSDEKNGCRACTGIHLTTVHQGGMHEAHPVPVIATRKMRTGEKSRKFCRIRAQIFLTEGTCYVTLKSIIRGTFTIWYFLVE